MNKLIQNWPHKWFGMWKEHGEGYENCPSIREFVDADLVSTYSFTDLENYLLNSQELAATSSYPDAFTGEVMFGSVTYITDGVWLWFDSLPYYIKKYNVAIPNSFLEHIKSNNYIPVEEWTGDFQSLDFPQ